MRWLPPHQDHGFTTKTGLRRPTSTSKLDSPVSTIPERTVVDRMIEWADVVENFRPGMAARHGFGWEQVHARNPRAAAVDVDARPDRPRGDSHRLRSPDGALAGYVVSPDGMIGPPIAPWGAYTDFVSPRFASPHSSLRCAIRPY